MTSGWWLSQMDHLLNVSTLEFTLHPGARHFTEVKLTSAILASVKWGVQLKIKKKQTHCKVVGPRVLQNLLFSTTHL